jgi:tetratricopeptide (TPR) repeat protein
MSQSEDIARLNEEAWRIRTSERARASELAQLALELAIKAKDRDAELQARIILTDGHSFGMELDKAQEELERCLGLLRSDTQKRTLIRLRHQQCYLSFQKGELPNVIIHGKQMLDCIKGRGYAEEQAWALQTMGIAYQRLGDPYRALTSYREAETHILKQGIKNHISNIRMSIGAALGELGQREEALQMFEEALNLRLSIGGDFHAGLIMGNMAKILHQLGQYTKALPRWDEAETYFKKAGGMQFWAQAIAGKADTLCQLKRPDEAVALLLAVMPETPDLLVSFRTNLLLSLSRAQADLKQWEASLSSLNDAAELLTDSIDHTQHVELHAGYHSAYKAMGDSASALYHHEQMLLHRDKSLNELSMARMAEWKAMYEVDRLKEKTDVLFIENTALREAYDQLRADHGLLIDRSERCMQLSKEMLGHLPAQHSGRFVRLFRSTERQLNDTDADSTIRERIAKAHPTLTPAELRVCGMVAMGRSGKEVADRLGISVKGVDKHRLSVRKKMNLPKSVSLQVYLEGLARRRG